MLATLFVVALLAAALNVIYPLPPLYPDGPATVVTSANGQVLRAFADRQGVHRYQVTVKDVDPFYLQALLNYEDRWFYYHPGINPLAIVRAAGQWLYHGRVISGGSTLTMQVARLIDPHQRSLSGKLKQAFRALQLEWYYSKSEILSHYLNLAPFGGSLQGVEAASQHYFGKSARALSKTEAALLVVLPQKPSRYRPDLYPEIAALMRNKVLDRLLGSAILDSRSVGFLRAEPVLLRHHPSPILAPLLSRELKRQSPDAHVIRTTLDHAIQTRIQRLLIQLSHQLPAKSSAAVLVIDNQTANVIAYQGAVDFHDDSRFSHVDMIRAVRSPGSTLKPFIYGLGLDLGVIHSASLLSDVPSVFGDYKPRNLNGRFQGAITVSEALKQSLNIPLIQVFNTITPQAFDDLLASADVRLHHDDANLSVGLGGTGADLLTLVSLYRSLAMQGQVTPLRFLAQEQTRSARTLLTSESSWIIYHTLSEITAPDRVVPSIRRKIAWKTGTSYGYRDFWSVGVSPDYTVGVWIGRPDASPMVGYLGATQAAPLMFDTFDQLPRDKHRIVRPQNVVKKTICWPGGRDSQATPASQCLGQKSAYTVRGITPPTLESHGQFVVGQAVWPTQLANWQQQKGLASPAAIKGLAVNIQYIKTGQHYYQDQIEQLPLVANTDSEQVAWFINHQLYSSSVLPLADYRGEVTISACLGAQCDVRHITVH
ncbi:penicillin-binding protein 1C [Photobacterium nomapromontoriensis]|uniref:penicillin-binding protein 1C n=1 Tax=Photobacterium nomapromontoriensis TaxID=2910237 RepID=UPI003D0EDC1D